MKTMFTLMSHTITVQQKNDARDTFNVSVFAELSFDIWSQIPAEHKTVESCLADIKAYLSLKCKQDDILLVQGDYGATFNMVQFSKEIGLVPVYATSKRSAYEVVDGEKIITVREFRHVRFRKY